jgi:hypothetical protein
MTFVMTVSPTIQSQIHGEMERLNLSLQEHPINLTLHDLYHQRISHQFIFDLLKDELDDSSDDDILGLLHLCRNHSQWKFDNNKGGYRLLLQQLTNFLLVTNKFQKC